MAKLYKEEELKEMLEKLQKSGCPFICPVCRDTMGLPMRLTPDCPNRKCGAYFRKA